MSLNIFSLELNFNQIVILDIIKLFYIHLNRYKLYLLKIFFEGNY
jgi:hypothetical protein